MIKPIEKQLEFKRNLFPVLEYDKKGDYTEKTKKQIIEYIDPYIEPLKKEAILDSIIITINDALDNIIVKFEYIIFISEPDNIKVCYRQYKSE